MSVLARGMLRFPRLSEAVGYQSQAWHWLPWSVGCGPQVEGGGLMAGSQAGPKDMTWWLLSYIEKSW